MNKREQVAAVAKEVVRRGNAGPIGKLPKPEMNKWERRYADRLELLKAGGEVAWFRFEGITLKLAPDCRYTPDFLVMLASGELELHEVKGFWRDDAKVKCRLAADLFPFPVLIVKPMKGGWDIAYMRKDSK